jgi:hypothetical protein
MTPGESIRRFCVECVGSPFEVRECGGDHCQNGGSDKSGVCLFFKYRLGRGRPSVKTIRKVCLWCQGDRADWVKDCHAGDCSLHPYRLGRNPNISEATKEKRRQTALKHGFNVPLVRSAAR